LSTLPLRLAPEVAEALGSRRAVVALESTLLAHGLPAPRRLEAAAAFEAVVRAEGAVPATLAVIDGVLRVGLDQDGLLRITKTEGTPIRKASLRDLSVALALGQTCATTVASSLAIAARAGVRVFATGGIGGVHREVLESFDESADLMALARYPVLTVSAGAKAVLDLPRTMERLESLGVPVVGYRTSELPAFYHGASGIRLAHRAEEPAELARILSARVDLLGEGGVLVVQPPPAEAAQDPARVGALIDRALAEARAAGVQGPAITPFLLARLDAASDGAVVETNLALVSNNVALAARIAVADAAARR
jgi:pseudouridine-5'-phosphate glycosidase